MFASQSRFLCVMCLCTSRSAVVMFCCQQESLMQSLHTAILTFMRRCTDNTGTSLLTQRTHTHSDTMPYLVVACLQVTLCLHVVPII